MGKTYKDIFNKGDNIPYGKKNRFPRNKRNYYMTFCPECGHQQPFKTASNNKFTFGALCPSCGYQWTEQWDDYK